MSQPRSQREVKERTSAESTQRCIACHVRHTDMAEVFSHDNQSYLPSLPNYGALRSGTKADLLVCVSKLVPHHDTVNVPEGTWKG